MYGNMCLVIVINNWNSLTAHSVNCFSINTFKKYVSIKHLSWNRKL